MRRIGIALLLVSSLAHADWTTPRGTGETVPAADWNALVTAVLGTQRALGALCPGGSSSQGSPDLQSFTPTTGSEGSSIRLVGVNLCGTTKVEFAGVAASFTVLSNTEIVAVMPATTSGHIQVTTPVGQATSVGTFTYGAGSVTSIVAENASVAFGGSSVQLAATVTTTGGWSTTATWALDPTVDGCGSLGASVTSGGLFSPPTSAQTCYPGNPVCNAAGTCKVIATAAADSSKTAVATVSITAPPPPEQAVPSSLLAFPGCEGSGCATRGAYSGSSTPTIYKITSLSPTKTNCTPSGGFATGCALKDCIEATVPRICVFAVAGSIAIDPRDATSTNRYLRVGGPYLTIMGQTAPGGGIEIKRSRAPGSDQTSYYGMRLDTPSANGHDIVIRYLKIRPGYPYLAGKDYGQGMGMDGLTYNTVIDHGSIAWAPWDNLSMSAGVASYNVTISNSLVAQPIYQASGSTNTQGATMNIEAKSLAVANTSFNFDFVRNVISTADERNPIQRLASGRIVNNVVYNYSWQGSKATGFTDVIGNYYKPGPATATPQKPFMAWNADSPSHNCWYTGTTNPTFYLSGNAGPGNAYNPAGDQWTSMTAWCSAGDGTCSPGTPIATTYRRTSPLCDDANAAGCYLPTENGASRQTTPITTVAASSLLDAPAGSNFLATVGASQRLGCTGAWVSNRDTLDTRLVGDVVDGTGPTTTHIGWPVTDGVATYDYPTLDAGTACTDTTPEDGLPDAWQSGWATHLGISASAVTPHGTQVPTHLGWPSGYTNIEAFGSGLAVSP